MHELSIASALRDQVLQHLPQSLVLRRASLDVGTLEHLDPAVLRIAWDSLASIPRLQGSALDIRHVPVRLRCRACDREYAPPHQAQLSCPHCSHTRPEVLEGWGIVLVSLETGPPDEERADQQNG